MVSDIQDGAADTPFAMQVEQELQRAASMAHEVDERQTRLKVDQQRLELQLAQAKEGMRSLSDRGHCKYHHAVQVPFIQSFFHSVFLHSSIHFFFHSVNIPKECSYSD